MVYAKFGDDRLWNDKADRKSDNDPKNKHNNIIGSAWGIPIIITLVANRDMFGYLEEVV